MSWNTTQDSSFNQSMDAPHSPPLYERKGVNTNVIEYIDPSLNESHLTGGKQIITFSTFEIQLFTQFSTNFKIFSF